jgi:hypothetical protein
MVAENDRMKMIYKEMVAGLASALGLLFAHRLLEKWLFGAIFCCTQVLTKKKNRTFFFLCLYSSVNFKCCYTVRNNFIKLTMTNTIIENVLTQYEGPKVKFEVLSKVNKKDFAAKVSQLIVLQDFLSLEEFLQNNPNVELSSQQRDNIKKRLFECFNEQMYNLLSQRGLTIDFSDILPQLEKNDSEIGVFCVKKLQRLEENLSAFVGEKQKNAIDKNFQAVNAILFSVFTKHHHLPNCEPIRKWFLTTKMFSDPSASAYKLYYYPFIKSFAKKFYSR